jgi:uncharacterized membrane protein (UPF0136 family)
MIEIARIHLFVFGAFAIIGGIIGFVKAKSRASLIAGVSSGLLLLCCAVAIGMGHPSIGLGVGLFASVSLAGRFVPAYRTSKKLMPAGLMAFFSVVGIILTIAAFVRP